MPWSDWGDCSEDCGPGTRERVRHCSDGPVTNSSLLDSIEPGQTVVVNGVTVQAEAQTQNCENKRCDSSGTYIYIYI